MAGGASPVTAAPPLTGIGGWLIVLAIGQVLGPLHTLVFLGAYVWRDLDSDLIDRLPLTVYGEMLLYAVFLAFTTCTAILFFRHSRLFPRFFIVEWILMAIFPLIDTAWVAGTATIGTEESFSDFLTLNPQDIVQIVSAVILGPIWIAYILRSRRVANTFVK
jgi:hypothetical protein